MSCNTQGEDLSALLDGELSGLDERRLRQHVATCAGCRDAYERLTRVSRSLGAWDAAHRAEPSASFARQVVETAIGRERAGRRRGRAALRTHQLWLVPLAAAAALMILLGATTAYLLSTGDRAEPRSVASLSQDPETTDPGTSPAVEVAVPDWPRVIDTPTARLPDPPDLGSALPPVVAETEPETGPPLTGEALYEKLGLVDSDGRRLSASARRKARDHREQEELLVRAMERKRQLLAKAPRTTGDRPPENPVATFVATLDEGGVRTYAGLTVVAIRDGHGDAGIVAIGLAQALREKVIKIREAGSRVTASNSDPDRHVFLAPGGILTGGHQDRVLTRAALIPPKTVAQIPVLCCEHGRSVGPSRFFKVSPGLAPPGIRRLLLGAQEQQAVWDRIALNLDRLDAKNSTQALREVYRRGRVRNAIKGYLNALLPVLDDGSAVGFAVFRGGELVGAEIFASHTLLESLGTRFLHSYVLEGLVLGTDGVTAGYGDVEAVLDGVADAAFIQFQGQGTEFVNREKGLCGAALVPVAGSRPLHVSVFRGTGGPVRGTGSGDSPPPGPSTGPAPGTGASDGEEEDEEDRRRRERRDRENGDVEKPRIDPPKVPPKGAGGEPSGTPPRLKPRDPKPGKDKPPEERRRPGLDPR
jgi:anti-sigma factor RsiW